MQLFITDEFKILKNNVIEISEKRIVDQLRKVLRAKQGYNFFIQNKIWNSILRYKVQVQQITDKVLWKIISKENKDLLENWWKWIIVWILNKFDKIELIIQKLTEIWIKKIYFTPMERSVFKQIKNNKLERFYKIALEATEQSWSYQIPDIKIFKNIQDISWYKAILSFDGELYKNINLWNIDFLVIWPEWGFTEKDIKQIEATKIIKLWDSILRAETAWILSWFILM